MTTLVGMVIAVHVLSGDQLMRSFRNSLALVAVAGAALTFSAFAHCAFAQDMRDRLKLTIPEGISSEVAHFPRGAPGTSTGSPIAFGAGFHDFFVGVGLQSPVRYGADADGGATVGFGLGDARDVIGFEVAINALSTVRSGIGNRVGFGGKAHKLFDGNWGIAVGVMNIVANKAADDGNPSVYGAVSKVVDLKGTSLGMFKSLTLTGGAGNEGFRIEKDIRNNNSTIGFFGSAALRVHEQVSVIGDWGGQDLSVGVSVVPFADFPLVLTPALADLTGSAGVHGRKETVRPRFTLGAGMAIRW